MKQACADDEQLSAYLDGELTGDAAQGVRAHLAHCSACASRFSDLQRLSELFYSLPHPDIDITGVLEERLSEGGCLSGGVLGWRPWQLVPLSLAAGVALTFGVVLGNAISTRGEPVDGASTPLLAPFELIPPGGLCTADSCYHEG